MKLDYVLELAGMTPELRELAEIRSGSPATTSPRSDRKVRLQQVRVGMKSCPRQALTRASCAMITSGAGGDNTSETDFQEAYKCCHNTTATDATPKDATPKEATPAPEEQDECS